MVTETRKYTKKLLAKFKKLTHLSATQSLPISVPPSQENKDFLSGRDGELGEVGPAGDTTQALGRMFHSENRLLA